MKREHPIEALSGIGSQKRKLFHQLGIFTIEDLLSYMPFRFESFSAYGAIQDLQDKQQAILDVVLEHIQNKRSPRKKMYITEAIVSDGSDRMRLVWFGQPYIAKTLSSGDYLRIQGKVSRDPFGYVMQNPQYSKRKKDELEGIDDGGSIFPVYRLTAGLQQKALRVVLKDILFLLDDIPDWIPEKIRKKAGIVSLGEAYKQMHAPTSHSDLEGALHRLKFDELLPIQLRAQQVRLLRSTEKAPAIPFDETVAKIFVGGLPFSLTPDQKLSAWHIFQDIQKDMPMNRLLIGDVGSGKTIVAAMVADMVIASGKVVAIMAPTEILAVQHYESFLQINFDRDARIGLITGSFVYLSDEDISHLSKQKKREHIKRRAQEGSIDILLGTHALLTKDVEIANLGLVIVDEQHRFGVEQRKEIKKRQHSKDESPHFLSMTATPIPRTFALAMYGDVDVSYIKTLPKERKQIITQYIPKNLRKTTYDFVRQELDTGRQAFVICSRIDESGAEQSDKKAVKQEFERLKSEEFSDYSVEMLHGKMFSKDKDDIMGRFANGEIDVLVSTSVIEVGVNIPNASVMIIEDAERFGLAQLHQFRGRVGRGEYQSYCLLFSESASSEAKDRLEFFANHSDGFSVAEYDLQRRGAGEVYGTKQSGEMNFRFASLLDIPIISQIERLIQSASEDEEKIFAEMLAKYEAKKHLE